MASRNLNTTSLLPTLKTIRPSFISIKACDVAKNHHLRIKGTSALSFNSRITKSTEKMNRSTFIHVYQNIFNDTHWVTNRMISELKCHLRWFKLNEHQLLKYFVGHKVNARCKIRKCLFIYQSPNVHRMMKPPGSFAFLEILLEMIVEYPSLNVTVATFSKFFLFVNWHVHICM